MFRETNVVKLVQRAQKFLRLNSLVVARALLDRAAEAAPENPVIPLNLSYVFRAQGDLASEMDALTRALTIDPYYFPALLAKAAGQERAGNTRQSAITYNDALKIAPPPQDISREVQDMLAHAREVVEDNTNNVEAFINERLRSARAQHSGDSLNRFQECQDVLFGRKKIFTQQPHMLHFPALPTIQFYDKADFPWLTALEAAAPAIQQELLGLLQDDAEEFRPYVLHPPWRPLKQWAELNHSPNWSIYFLWEGGERLEAHCERCPRTVVALESVPLCNVPGFAPAVFFSTLAPHTKIPAHTGVTNTRLVVHLPLIVPEGCWFRVGNDRREWQVGQALIFDDTIEHEAWNGSDELRVVLIFDIWNPHLTIVERELVCSLLNGVRDFYEG